MGLAEENSTTSTQPEAPASPALFADPDAFSINLEFFSGPMDLLLHLVQQHEVSIEEVEMSEIADQYLEIVSRWAHVDLEKATEFLVIAATLLALKSQMILPEQGELDVSDVDTEGEDAEFLEELRKRLIEYEKTKKQAVHLQKIPQLGVDTFVRIDRKNLQPTPDMILEEPEDSHTLGSMFVQLLHRIGEKTNSFRVRLEPITVVDFMMRTIDLLSEKVTRVVPKTFMEMVAHYVSTEKKTSQLFSQNPVERRMAARNIVTGSFISMLELTRRGIIAVRPDSAPNSIGVALKLVEADAATDTEDKVIQISDYLEANQAVSASEDAHEEEAVTEERKEANRE